MGGGVFAGKVPSAIVGPASGTATLSAKITNVILNSPNQLNTITFENTASVSADPPPITAAPSAGRTDSVLNVGAPGSLASVNFIQPVQAVQASATFPVTAANQPLVDSASNLVATSNAKVAANNNDLIETPLFATNGNLLQGGITTAQFKRGWISQTELDGGEIPADIFSDYDLGIIGDGGSDLVDVESDRYSYT